MQLSKCMRGKYDIRSFRKIRTMETEIESKMFFVTQVKCPQLLTDRIQSYVLCSASVESARMTFQENHSHGSQDTFDRVLRSPSKVPLLLTNRCQSYTFCRTCLKSDGIKFPEWKPRHSAQGNMFPKQSAIHYWRIATKLTSFPEKARRVRNMTYQENSSN